MLRPDSVATPKEIRQFAIIELSPKRARTMLARLRTIGETSGDAELAELAVKVRKKLLG